MSQPRSRPKLPPPKVARLFACQSVALTRRDRYGYAPCDRAFCQAKIPSNTTHLIDEIASMLSHEQALARLKKFEEEIPRLYPASQEDYRKRVITPSSILDYLRAEQNRFVEIAMQLPSPSKQGAKLLDVGIAYGFLTVLLQEQGWKCEGLEVSENIPVYCKLAEAHKIPIHAGHLGIKTLPFENESFDAIIFSEVLEHLRLTPALAFCEFRRLLSKGGLLFVTTPNFSRLTNVLKLLAGRNPVEKFPEDILSEDITEHLTHIREYTMREVRGLCEQQGFEIIQARYSRCMEKGRPHSLLTALVPAWRGNLMVLARKK
jgi:2-polyprenyl-3-methyl-5-hydroxy-6-metoxy-1,4-benzoquinol methylase